MLGPTDHGGVTPYQALIRDTRRAKDMSVSELARRADMPRSTIHKIENQPPRDRPADVTVDKLASALGIPRRQILDAVSESLGLRVSYGQPALIAQQLLDVAESLSPEQRDRWYRLARALADALASEDERVVNAQSEKSGLDGIAAQHVAIDRSMASHGEQTVAAGPDGSAPPTPAEREYMDTVSDAALEQMRRKHLGE